MLPLTAREVAGGMPEIGHRRGWTAAPFWLLLAWLTASLIWVSAPLLAQEIPAIQQTELSAEEAEALLEGLAPDEVRELCREDTALRSTAPCRRALKGSGERVDGTSEGGIASSSERPGDLADGSVGPAEAPAAAPPAGVRAQATRPRISVNKSNDADRNGVYTSDEVAPSPGADVSFRVKITNLGRRAVRIERILDSYRETHEEVCGELLGRRIPPSASKRCTFVLEEYAPSRFDSVANTVDVTVQATSSGRRRTASDISTVTTLSGGGDEVLGETATGPGAGDQGGMASTGFDLRPSIALAMALLASGAGLLRLGDEPISARRLFRRRKRRAGKPRPPL
jgi:hypothetical protein